MGRFVLDNDGGEIEVISGDYETVKGPASTFTPVNLLNAKLNKSANADFSFPANYNTALLVVEGSVKVNNSETIATDHFVLFSNDGENFTIEAQNNAVVLLLSGEPIREPIAAHGPFVMNTRQEIIQAFEDFNNGKFGYLE